nr:hypothetical protein [Tanacetum cinerariifolium]
MSDSTGGMSDLDDMDDIEMIMQQLQSSNRKFTLPRCFIRFVDLACIFGVAGANNDLDVLNNSSLFDDLLDDIAPVAPFERRMHYLNGNKKLLEKILKELLGSFKEIGILSVNRRMLGQSTSYAESYEQHLSWRRNYVGHNKYSNEAGCRRTRKSSATVKAFVKPRDSEDDELELRRKEIRCRRKRKKMIITEMQKLIDRQALDAKHQEQESDQRALEREKMLVANIQMQIESPYNGPNYGPPGIRGMFQNNRFQNNKAISGETRKILIERDANINMPLDDESIVSPTFGRECRAAIEAKQMVAHELEKVG